MRTVLLPAAELGQNAVAPVRFADGSLTSAKIIGGHLLAADFALPALPQPVPHLITWSGGCGDGLFEPSPRTWMGEGWRRLVEVCRRIEPALRERDACLHLRTHAAHVLADPHVAKAFLKELASDRFAVLPDLSAMLTREMLPKAHDHLERMLDDLAPIQPPMGVVLTNLASPDAQGTIAASPVHRGVLDPAWLAALVAKLPGLTLDLALIDTEVETQLKALGIPA